VVLIGLCGERSSGRRTSRRESHLIFRPLVGVRTTLNKTGRTALAAAQSHKLQLTLTVRLTTKKITVRTIKTAAKKKQPGKH
jgi:hypothetical protein